MTLLADPAQPEGNEVFVIAYDEEGNELRLSPNEALDVLDRSRDLAIGQGRHEIIRIKHGPFVGPEVDIRSSNVGSLAAAMDGNYLGTKLYVDRSAPPVDEDILEIDERYHLDVHDGGLVAVVTARHPNQPNLAEIEVSLARIAAAYDCTIVDVSPTLAGGGTPEEFLIDWPDEPGFAHLRAEQLETLAGMAHDVHISVTISSAKATGGLIDGATAIADFINATKDGPLDAAGVLNLLRGGHHAALVGEVESDFLEVKTTMHPVGVAGTAGERAKIELAQDIARFANADVDAVMVIGLREASGAGRNEIGSVTPIANSLLNPARISEILDARIVPPVEGLIIEKFAVTESESLLAIFVPKQPKELQPYLVHGAIVGDKVEGAFFSIVRRRGEGSITTSAHQIHAYIVAGKRYLRDED